MEYIKEVTINEAVVHVLDNNSNEPILNEHKLDLNEEIYSFISKHIEKCLKDETLKYAVFNREKTVVKDISQQFLYGEVDFLDTSKELARQMFLIMRSKGGIASCDLIIASVSTEYGPLLAIMKMDYIKSYMHNIEFSNNKIDIGIIPQHRGLPGSSQKIQKCAFIKPIRKENDFDLMVIDKKIKNKKSEEYGSSYFTDYYLDCRIVANERDITKSFIQASERWTRTCLKENAEMQEKVRKVIKDKLKEKNEFNVNEIAEDIFGDEIVSKESFVNFVKEDGGVEKVAVDKAWVDKKFKRIRLKIDKDIDIYLNEEAYNDNSRFEIKRNGDGSINMIIKNISNYIEK